MVAAVRGLLPCLPTVQNPQIQREQNQEKSKSATPWHLPRHPSYNSLLYTPNFPNTSYSWSPNVSSSIFTATVASTYVAAPCQEGIELSNEEESDIYGEHAETSRALFMSAEIGVEEEGRSSGKEEETLTLKRLNAPDEFVRKQSVTDKDNMQLIGDTEFEKRLTSADKDQTIMDVAIYHFDGETDLSGLADYGESLAIPRQA
ncbi:hypothetical protein ACFX2F_025340 [Malus domestica]